MLRTLFLYTLVIMTLIAAGCGLSKRETSDPNVALSFAEVLDDPEAYIDKVLTFEAVVKRTRSRDSVELYTNRKLRQFTAPPSKAPCFSLGM